MIRSASIAAILIQIIACSSPEPSHPKRVASDAAVSTDSQSTVRRTVQNRQGNFTDFKLARTHCTNGSNFVNAIKQTAPLVVGVAAGEFIAEKFTPRALGTGIILAQSGLILAHHHTVLDFSSIRIRLIDGTVKQAEWLGEDRRSDLVLLSIGGKNHPVPTLASADTLSIGQWVASLGSPFGLQQSISAGLVSDRSRAYPSPVESKLVRFVQSDVVIHPGSSGGPLIDACGRIVAMNSAILGPGMSFSLRIDEAVIVAEKLYAEGEFDRGFIGITAHLTSGKNNVASLQVQRVVPGGPADQAGIKAGDHVTHVNDEAVITKDRLKWLVAITEPGELIKLRIERQGVSSMKAVEVDSSL